MLLRRLSVLLACAMMLFGLTGVASAAPASASGCSYNVRLGSQPVYAPTGAYVGYVEILYAGPCRSTQAHFHIDSSFRANHSGWNVDLSLWNDQAQPVRLQDSPVTNSSATEFYTNASPIDGQRDYTFMGFVSWRYNGCLMETGSSWWNYGNGTASNNTWGDGSGTC